MTIALIRQHLQDLAPLGNVALSRKEGWREFADAPSLVAPEVLTRRQLRALTADDAEVYNHFRQLWHANLGPIRTPQLTTLHEQLSTVVDSNLQFGDKAKGAVAIDAYPGLGKTTSVLAFAKDFHRREIRIKGTHTRDGHQRWPVCRVGLTGNTGLKEFNRAMLEFYAHPGNTRGTSADLSRRALDCVTSCETRLLVVDDLHFLRVHAPAGWRSATISSTSPTSSRSPWCSSGSGWPNAACSPRRRRRGAPRWWGCGRSRAGGAIATAVAVTAAAAILDRSDIADAGESLRWLVHGGRRLGRQVDAGVMGDWGSATSTRLVAIQVAALRPLFVRAVDQLRYRSAAPVPSRPSANATAVDDAVRRIPTLLWPQWSLRCTVTPCSSAQVRPALSTALLLVGTTLTVGEAADRLGSAVPAGGVTRTLAHLRNAPHWDDTLTALTLLADHLRAEPPPIDYERRRRLDYRDLLPEDLWKQICRRTGTPPGAGQKADFARCLLFERLSGLPASQSPFLADDYDVRAKLSGFPRALTPALSGPLDQAARRFLDDHGLDEEPVYWHPPLHLLDGLELPGPNPAAVDLAALHDLTRHEHTALSEIARQLATTLDVIRHLLENHPAPASPTAAERFERRVAQTAAEETLSRAQFVDLYCVQRRTLAEIAAMIGASRKVTGRLARHHGIAPSAGGPPVDPAWFHHQYVTQRRTLRDLGHEVGRSVSRMSRIAKDYGIPIRPPTDAGNPQSVAIRRLAH